jgi:hypothetical protein
MKSLPIFLLFSALLALPAMAGSSRASDSAYAVNYEGGTLRLEHRKVTATLGDDLVVIKAGRRKISVPARSITEIAYGSGVRRRFGAAVLDVVPFTHLGEAETFYVGVSWIDETQTGEKGGKTEAVFRLNGSEYHEFLAALERLTGKKAVDTNQVPTVVRYGL